jgi:hypothetical protein
MANKKEAEQDAQEEKQEKKYDLTIPADHVGIFRDGLSDEAIKQQISDHLEKLIDNSEIKDYVVLFLYDDDNSINTFHSNRIYQAAKDVDNKNNILMIVQSGGGNIEPAYLISKT